MIRVRIASFVVLFALVVTGCSKEELPSRDEIPILKLNLFALEQGIINRDRVALDSLLLDQTQAAGQGIDSLLRFVYGPADSYRFFRLGDYEFFFSNDVAVINCFIMDSTEGHERPLELQYQRENDRWLLKEFKVDSPAGS